MRILLHVVFFAFTTSLFSGAAWSQTEPALIPRQAIFSNPDKEQVMLSPDGKWIGYRALVGATMNVWVAPAKSEHIGIGTDSSFRVNHFVSSKVTIRKVPVYASANDT